MDAPHHVQEGVHLVTSVQKENKNIMINFNRKRNELESKV
jgi:hypothetical protein